MEVKMVKGLEKYPTASNKSALKLLEEKRERIRKYSLSKAEMEELHPHTLLILIWIYLLVLNEQSKGFQKADNC
jgi:hypothetical protein